jgi:UDP-N-acetylmuramoyl-L-alanyl-D-glutamate--2,6-diaminopimelate ligase
MIEQFKNIFLEYTTDEIDFSGLEDLTTNLQEATSSDIAFYRIRNGSAAAEAFRARETKGDPGLLVTTGHKLESSHQQIHLDEDQFAEIQQKLADALYPLNGNMKIIGVTGTNGKTSIVHLCRELCSKNGVNAASIGTLGIIHSQKGELADLGTTSPGYVDLRRVLFQLSELKTEVVFCEVSSHALDQKRFGNGEIQLDQAAWTNLTQDHLDYHGSMENYFQSKLKILELLKDGGNLFVHKDEKEIVEKLEKYSQVKISDDVKGLPLAFENGFARKNFELAHQLVSIFVGEKKLKLGGVHPPKGRFSVLTDGTRQVVIDYAHTPDALENICKEVKENFDGPLTVVFGCGGDRDAGKRPLMGSIAEKYGDQVIVTNDNPRTEDPEMISKDIIKGMKKDHQVILDRRTAIDQALATTPGGVVLIAGKGHEEYQEINGQKNHFSDFEVVEEILGIK